MAIDWDLGNQYISASYQKLIQISGSDNTLVDGTGSIQDLTVQRISGDGSGLTNISASNVLLSTVDSATYANVRDANTFFGSTGIFIGGEIMDDGDGTITINSGSGAIRSEKTVKSELKFTDWTITSGSRVTLIPDEITFFYVDWNGGLPYITGSTIDPEHDLFTKIFLGKVYVNSDDPTDVHINDKVRHVVSDHGTLTTHRFQQVAPFAREYGGMISETGVRNVTVTAGQWFEGLTEFQTVAFDSSGIDTYDAFYRSGSGWTETGSISQIDNQQYDDGSGTLVTLGVNRYGVHWIFLAVDSHVHIVYGQGNYTLNNARDASMPSSLPKEISINARIVGKIIVQRGSSTFIDVLSAFEESFEFSTVDIHNDLTGLQGGTVNEYYHLTQTEHDMIVGGAFTGSFSGSFTGDGSGLFNVPGVSNQYELELMLVDTQRSYYKSFTYDAGNLMTSSFWETSAMSNLVFEKTFTYDTGFLTSSIVVRQSDSKTLTKTFYYDGGGNLTNVNVAEA